MRLFEVTFEKTDTCPKGIAFPRKFWVAAPSMDYAEAAVVENTRLGFSTHTIVELGQIDKWITESR
jgi:hypothetical protein